MTDGGTTDREGADGDGTGVDRGNAAETRPDGGDGGDAPPRVVVSDTKLTDLDVERAVFAGRDVDLVQHELRSVGDFEAVASGAVALVVDAGTDVTADALERCPSLRVVVRAGVGVDNIDVEAARERGVAVSNVPDYSVDEVSTHAHALLLSLLRGVPEAAADTAAGGWNWAVAAPLYRTADMTLGVVGCGRLGGATVEKALPFFDRVLAADPYVDDGEIEALGAEPADLLTLCRGSDAVTLHTPLTLETDELVDATAFDAMREGRAAREREGVVLVNTARGAVVDADALVAALDDGTVRAAGLDVLPEEPPRDDRLTGRDDVVATPHVAWYSEESMREVRRKAAEEVGRALFGGERRYAADDGTAW